MNQFAFSKIQATGNDFVLIDDTDELFPKDDWKKITTICDRRFGIGADGLLLLRTSKIEGLDFEMVYRNSDGSYAEMCGNGARAIIRFFSQLNNKTSGHVKFHVDKNIYTAAFDENQISLEMTQIQSIDQYDLESFNYGEKSLYLDTGVPHCVFFSKEEPQNFVEWAAPIRFSEIFPNGSNINHVKVVDANQIQIKTYERGVEGETYSCGTGVTACAIAYKRLYQNTEKVKVRTKGGDLEVLFRDEKVFLKGPAELVFQGKWESQ